MFAPAAREIFTIGHSTRTFDEFLALLEGHSIGLLVDVRHFPISQRAPWATAEFLSHELPPRGTGYVHLEALGGFRKARPDSANTGWKNLGFRGYADHMATPEFIAGLNGLLEIAATRRTAIMCAEAVPWKCHRSLLSDSLLARGVRVIHILSGGKTQGHRLTPFARVHGVQVTYPGPRKAA